MNYYNFFIQIPYGMYISNYFYLIRVSSVMPKYGRDIWLVNTKSTNNSDGNSIC